nr:PREDICTED: uncharacterized protein LOC106488628 [Apteryx mantelli mantelli]
MEMTRKQWSFSLRFREASEGHRVFMEGCRSFHSAEGRCEATGCTGVYRCFIICLFLGPICSELPGIPFFPDFCAFSFYRCTRKRYFIKRTACPGESKAKLGSAQAFNNQTTNGDAALSVMVPSSQPVFPTFPTAAQPVHSSPDMEVAVISTSLPEGAPWSRSMQLNPSDIHVPEVTVSGQQRGQLPTSDLQDLFLRLQDIHVQSSLQTLQQLLNMGKAVGEDELQAAALKLLVAMNNASVSGLPDDHH